MHQNQLVWGGGGVLVKAQIVVWSKASKCAFLTPGDGDAAAPGSHVENQ